MKRLLWVLPAVLLLAACAAQGAPSSAGSGQAFGSAATDGAVGIAKSGVAVGAPPQTSETGSNGVPVPQAFDPTRSIILTANVAMKATDPWATADKAQAVATDLGGDVIGLNESGTKDDRVASLTLRVPSAQFTEALRRLRALDADVTSSTVNGQDVSDQFVDLKARLAAKQAEEDRYNALLGRAATVDEILKVDAALSNVRTQIEQLQGQVNSINSRTQFSTITVSVSPAIVQVGTPSGTWDPSKTVAQAFATLAAVLRGFADATIWLLVFGWIPLVALALVLILTRGRRVARTTA
ncbi:MAG TPA: DUF4349 domain-containing protein [Candidatus Saccharimonadales bacterium]|jgi:hypothetical protein|nr:DUF4349 domain-containing protein [Candidatus Saccharimonadales bacterium]